MMYEWLGPYSSSLVGESFMLWQNVFLISKPSQSRGEVCLVCYYYNIEINQSIVYELINSRLWCRFIRYVNL